jgi:uncharacterized membrane protein YqiK
MTLIVKEHNVETGEIIERKMNAEELAQYENDQTEAEAIAIKQSEAKAAKAAAEAKLTALGLTADDLKALGLGNN